MAVNRWCVGQAAAIVIVTERCRPCQSRQLTSSAAHTAQFLLGQDKICHTWSSADYYTAYRPSLAMSYIYINLKLCQSLHLPAGFGLTCESPKMRMIIRVRPLLLPQPGFSCVCTAFAFQSSSDAEAIQSTRVQYLQFFFPSDFWSWRQHKSYPYKGAITSDIVKHTHSMLQIVLRERELAIIGLQLFSHSISHVQIGLLTNSTRGVKPCFSSICNATSISSVS